MLPEYPHSQDQPNRDLVAGLARAGGWTREDERTSPYAESFRRDDGERINVSYYVGGFDKIGRMPTESLPFAVYNGDDRETALNLLREWFA